MEKRCRVVKLDEASLARAYQHVVEKKVPSWGMLTAYRYANTKKENIQANKMLEKDLRSKGYGFFKVEGHWQECQDSNLNYIDCPEGKLQDSIEVSLFVPNMKKRDIELLCKKYEQDAVIYGGEDTKGDAHLIFKNGSEDNIGKFTANKISQGYSKMKGDRVFTFLGKGDSGEKYKKPEPAADTTSQKMVSNPTQLKSLLPKGIANKMVKNPDTGRMIKVKSALKYDKNSPVYKSTMAMIKNTKK